MYKNNFIENYKYITANKILENLELSFSKINANKNINVALTRFAIEEQAKYFGHISSKLNNATIAYSIDIEFDIDMNEVLRGNNIPCKFKLEAKDYYFGSEEEYEYSIEKEMIFPDINTEDIFIQPLTQFIELATKKLDFVNVKPLTKNDIAKSVVEGLKNEDLDNNTGILWDKVYDSEITVISSKSFDLKLQHENPMKNIGLKIVIPEDYNYVIEDLTDLSKVKYLVFDVFFYYKDKEVRLFEFNTEDILFSSGVYPIYWHILKIKDLLNS